MNKNTNKKSTDYLKISLKDKFLACSLKHLCQKWCVLQRGEFRDAGPEKEACGSAFKYGESTCLPVANTAEKSG